MFREIKKKRLILENRKPYDPEVSRFIYEMNVADWTYSSIRLDGMNMSRQQIDCILKGEFLVDVSVSGHAAVGNYQQMIKSMYEMADMQVYLNEKVLFKIYQLLEKPISAQYRKNNPVLRMLNYNPPHFKEIDEQMKLLFNWLHSDLHQYNPIEKAAYLHNKLIEVYPFETGTEAIARAIAQYHLMIHGYPPVLWNISEQEYFDALSIYLKKENIQPIYEVLERGVFNKLEVMMQLTAD